MNVRVNSDWAKINKQADRVNNQTAGVAGQRTNHEKSSKTPTITSKVKGLVLQPGVSVGTPGFSLE